MLSGSASRDSSTACRSAGTLAATSSRYFWLLPWLIVQARVAPASPAASAKKPAACRMRSWRSFLALRPVRPASLKITPLSSVSMK